MIAPHSGRPAPPEDAAHEFLRRLKTPSHLLVAYSGGGDSSGLLVALAACVKSHDLAVTLSAATVDHGLREGSLEEAFEAGALCRDLGISHAVLRWEGEKPATGIQAAGREARYRLLAEHAHEIGADLIVTGHTLDDQIETSAMRRARNPDSSGGISQAVLYDRRIWVVRPFLGVQRADIRDYLSAHKISWVDDPSNDNVKFERVRVRKARADDAPVADFDALAKARRTLAAETARFLEGNAAIHFGRVVEFDLTHFDVDEPAHQQALLYLAAFIGGRSHVAGRETSARILEFLRSGETRLAAERVVFDRRTQKLYLVRERRLLPEVVIQPGETVVWDNRFRIANSGKDAVTISVRKGAVPSTPLLPADFPDLPNAVRQLVQQTEPVVVKDQETSLKIEPIIANLDRFLPFDVFVIANVLAKLAALAHFPDIPTR
jgi:tRNA(Ile)-lysidine synthase